MSVEPVFWAPPALRYSLAGVHMKVSVQMRYRLACVCGWSVIGDPEPGGTHMIGDPTTEVYPIVRPAPPAALEPPAER